MLDQTMSYAIEGIAFLAVAGVTGVVTLGLVLGPIYLLPLALACRVRAKKIQPPPAERQSISEALSNVDRPSPPATVSADASHDIGSGADASVPHRFGHFKLPPDAVVTGFARFPS